jgi:hypothetical protein
MAQAVEHLLYKALSSSPSSTKKKKTKKHTHTKLHEWLHEQLTQIERNAHKEERDAFCGL